MKFVTMFRSWKFFIGPVARVVTPWTVPKLPAVSVWRTVNLSSKGRENRFSEPPKLAWPRSVAVPGPRSMTTPPMVEFGKKELAWWLGPLVSPQAIPSYVMLNSPSLKPRIVILAPSVAPGPFAFGTPAIDGASIAVVVKSPTRGVDSSMNLRVITACGSVAFRDDFTGAASAALPTGAVTFTASTSGGSVSVEAARSAACATDRVSVDAATPITRRDASFDVRRREFMM